MKNRKKGDSKPNGLCEKMEQRFNFTANANTHRDHFAKWLRNKRNDSDFHFESFSLDLKCNSVICSARALPQQQQRLWSGVEPYYALYIHVLAAPIHFFFAHSFKQTFIYK